MIYLYNGILLHDKKEQIIAACNNMNEFLNHYADSKKANRKEHIMHDSIYMKFDYSQNESMVIEIKSLLASVGTGTGQDIDWEEV